MNIVVETSEADQRAEEEDLLRDIKGLFAMPFQVRCCLACEWWVFVELGVLQLFQSNEQQTLIHDAACAWDLLQVTCSDFPSTYR
jgi:hypothetical protein